MNDKHDCPFCAIVAGQDSKVREIARNNSVIAFFPTNPATIGHCMVIPRRHAGQLTDLTHTEVTDVMLAVQTMVKSLHVAFQPEGINIVQSNGEAATQTVPHVHVHVVPRWEDDQLGEFWPSETHYSESIKNLAQTKLRAVTVLPNSDLGAEDKRQHLAFAQSVITRMAQSSSNAKSWLLPVVTAAYGYAFVQSAAAIAILGIIATLVFGMLDIGYLQTERKYRDLYERIAADDTDIPPYSLNYKKTSDTWKTYFRDFGSTISAWAIWPFYNSLLVTGGVAFYFAL